MGRKRSEQSAGTKKTAIIEMLFNKRWDVNTSSLSEFVVTLEEVRQAIGEYNEQNPTTQLSAKNPANFFKDFIRRRSSANENWPRRVMERGYTARQRTGSNACFEFVRLVPGQTEPFPVRTPPPTELTPRYKIESVSLPLASRRLGRRDETWLVQVLVRLRVIETHFALVSKRKVIQLDHLQMGVKLRKCEIDALFLAIEQKTSEDPESQREIIVCCEAKGLNDDILQDQVLAQVQAVFRIKGLTQDLVLPIAVKAIGASRVHVIEFDVVARSDAPNASLSIVGEAVYELVPSVPGIGV